MGRREVGIFRRQIPTVQGLSHDAYEQIADEYRSKRLDRSSVSMMISSLLDKMPASGVVLDVGSGLGQDSPALGARGHGVVSVDRSMAMLRLAKSVSNFQVCADLRALSFRNVSGIWACASLLHVERREVRPALVSFREALTDDGALHLSVKAGIGAGLESEAFNYPLWFTYWNRDEIDQTLVDAGYRVLANHSQSDDKWLSRLAVKRLNPGEKR